MKERVIKCWRTYEQPEGQIFTDPSLTVPNQTMPLRELLERFTRGEAVALITPNYTGEEETLDLERLDEMDKLDLMREVTEGIKETQTRIDRRKKEKAKKLEESEEEKKLLAEAQKELEEVEKPKPKPKAN